MTKTKWHILIATCTVAIMFVLLGILGQGATAKETKSSMRFVLSGRLLLKNIGGLSGLELDVDGNGGLAVSDRGQVYFLDLLRRDGSLSFAYFHLWKENPKLLGDLEGVASLDQGDYYFSYEKPGVVKRVLPSGKIIDLPRHPLFDKMKYNSALEAIAIDEFGALYTLPEEPVEGGEDFPLFKFSNGEWKIITKIPKRGSFMAVGADFGPDGLFYLLERAVSPIGFLTRVRRFDLSASNLSEEVLLRTLPYQHDNLEAISIWRDTNGFMRATMLSDNNFLAVQKSEIVEYILQPRK